MTSKRCRADVTGCSLSSRSAVSPVREGSDVDLNRWLELDGCVNARDVGGLPTTSGLTTRTRTLIRSDAVHQLSERDVRVLVDEIGVRHVVDLRSAGERREHPRGRLSAAGVTHSELDVLTDEVIAHRRSEREAAFTSGQTEPAILIGEGYSQFLELGRHAFVDALELLAEADGTPALVHCTAGKDRTGVLVALLLELAGVDRRAVVADYAATGERIELVRQRLAATPAYVELARTAPEVLLSAPAEAMAGFLRRLDAEIGGARQWFLDAGASNDAIDSWCARILSDPAATA